MSKPAHAELVPKSALSVGFIRQVRELASEGRELAKSYADLTTRMLRFSQRFRQVRDEAQRLDGEGDGQHRQHLREQLADAVRSTNKTVWSQWVTIGSQAKALLPHRNALPPQRDSLYELALAAREKRPIQVWIKQNKLAATSTVRDVQALRARQRRKKRARTYQATVTLCFQTYDAAAKALEAVITTDADFKVKAHQAFQDATKALLGADAYDAQKARFVTQ